MAARKLPFLAAVPLAALGACAAPGPYPSLAVRPAEEAFAQGDEERQPTPIAEDPELSGQISVLMAEARRGGEEFGAALPAAEAAVARAGGTGSDSWVEAQQAVSRLEAARARTTKALADLDALALARAGAVGEADVDRLSRAAAELQALADGQAERIGRLQTSLSGR